jgi:hypothetical protein
MIVKNLLFIFSLLAVLSTPVLASNEIVPEDSSDAGTVTDITIESATITEDSQSDSNANSDEEVVDYEDALKKMDEEMMIKE